MIKYTEDGCIKAGFEINTTEFRKILKLMKAALPQGWEQQKPYCELTIKTNKVEFGVSGVKRVHECESWGPAKVTIAFLHLLYLVKDNPRIKTNVNVGDDFMTVNSTKADVVTWFFQDDSILRSIDLPANYDIVDILNLPHRYTPEEIEFNKLKQELETAHKTMYSDIQKVAKILKKYRIYEPSIQGFVTKSLY